EGAEVDTRWAAEVGELVEGGADGAAGVDDVVHDDYGSAIDAAGGQPCLADDRPWSDGHEVIAVECDIEGPDRDRGTFGALDLGGEALGEVDAAAVDTEESEAVGTAVEFYYLACHPRDGALDGALVQQGLSPVVSHMITAWVRR